MLGEGNGNENASRGRKCRSFDDANLGASTTFNSRSLSGGRCHSSIQDTAFHFFNPQKDSSTGKEQALLVSKKPKGALLPNALG
jgi:hypothetical protein